MASSSLPSPSALVDRLADAVARHPLAALALTNGATAAYALYVVSDGKPLEYVKKRLFRAALSLAPKALVDAEMDKVRAKIEESVVGHAMDGVVDKFTELPAKGLPAAAVIDALEKGAAKDREKWNNGQVSGSVYHGGDALSAVIGEAFTRYSLSNPLHPDLFPSVRKMEAEVVAMTLKLFHGGPDAVGTLTSGGTESILMAMKAYRDYARTTRGVVDPELVVPATAHAAFDKACDYFRIKLVKVPVGPVSFRADLAATAAAVTRNTIALVGSAPCFPQGVIDPIPALAALAVSRGLPLHVDCCLGSYLVALAEEATGTKLPFAFDFGVPGVTSISADTHKYGFAPKGSSVVMYSAPAYRHAQYFVAPEWTGGIYASPTIAGSRPGALVAGCWATLVHVGRDGYLDAARAILGAARAISDGVAAIPQLELYGSTDLSVVCFGPRRGGGGKPLNIYNVSDALVARGWNLNVLQNPACVHLCVTFANAGSAGRFLADLRAAVDAVLTAPPGAFKDGTGAIYGMAEAIPDKSLVGQIAYSFLDALYKA